MTISLLKQVGSEGAGKKGRKAALCKQKQSLRPNSDSPQVRLPSTSTRKIEITKKLQKKAAQHTRYYATTFVTCPCHILYSYEKVLPIFIPT